jgi:glutamate synthase domain-containing protein 2
MSNKNETREAPNRVALYLAVAGVLLVALIAVWLFRANWGTASSGVATVQQRADADWVKQKAKESGGVFSQLSQEDQQKMTKLYGAMAPKVLEGNSHPSTDF